MSTALWANTGDAHAAQPEVAAVERLPDALDLGRVAADHVRGDQLLHRRVDRVQAAAQRLQVAHAGEPPWVSISST
jgi:hypothetical protein